IPDGGFLLRGRPARAARLDPRPARSRCEDGERQDARREPRGREDLQPRSDPASRKGADSLGGPRGPARQPRARRRHRQAGGCVLHVAPESWVGGPLALVKTGDTIELDVPRRRLQVMIDDAEMMKRKRAWKAPARRFERGYGALFSQHIRQANEGCDFDFLEGTASTPEPEIH